MVIAKFTAYSICYSNYNEIMVNHYENDYRNHSADQI